MTDNGSKLPAAYAALVAMSLGSMMTPVPRSARPGKRVAGGTIPQRKADEKRAKVKAARKANQRRQRREKQP